MPATIGMPAAPSAVIFLRKSRRPAEFLSMLTPMQIVNDIQSTKF